MTDKLLEQIPIGPQLTLELYDCSRLLAGDRWKVVLEARLEISLESDLWTGDQIPEPSQEAMGELLGAAQSFVQRRERVFVAAEEKQDLIEAYIQGFKKDMVPYLKHPAFVKRFLEKQYRHAKERSQWSHPSP